MKHLWIAGVAGLVIIMTSCGGKQQKEGEATTDTTTGVAKDSGIIQKPALSITDSVKQLQEKDTAKKMIDKAPATVSIHLDSIP